MNEAKGPDIIQVVSSGWLTRSGFRGANHQTGRPGSTSLRGE